MSSSGTSSGSGCYASLAGCSAANCREVCQEMHGSTVTPVSFMLWAH